MQWYWSLINNNNLIKINVKVNKYVSTYLNLNLLNIILID